MVFAYFWPSGGSKIDQKSIKIASQSGLKLRCRKNTQKSSEMVPTWLQKRPKLGAQNALGPVWGPSKSEERTTPKTRLEKTDFWSHLGPDKAKTILFLGTAVLTRGVGGLQICKDWQETCMGSITAAPLTGGAGSNCPAGQLRHRALRCT